MAKKMVSFFPKRYGFLQNIFFGEEYGIIFVGLSNIMMKKDRKADWRKKQHHFMHSCKRGTAMP